MATAVKTCRVCGKSYEACRTERAAGVFRWQEVACSPECGAEYLRRVTEARNPSTSTAKTGKAKRRATPVVEADAPVETPVVESEDEVADKAFAEAPVENE